LKKVGNNLMRCNDSHFACQSSLGWNERL